VTDEAAAAYITWMRRRWILAAAAALIVSGCGSSSAAQPSQDHRSELRISEVRVPNSPIPIEGEISYVRVTDGHGATVRSAKLPFGGKAIRMWLRAGSYTVLVWHRFCDLNCGTLDPPGDRCRHAIDVRARTRTDVVVRNRPGSPCRIVMTTRSAAGG
jgi:hypothetical protein